jgi:hypothetical protein
MGMAALGRSLYLSGRAAEAREVLDDLVGYARRPTSCRSW